jgi:hypothetical protein
MFGLEQSVTMYLLGFALVWAVVLLACATVATVRRYRHDWDRAFSKELAAQGAETPAGLPAAAPRWSRPEQAQFE